MGGIKDLDGSWPKGRRIYMKTGRNKKVREIMQTVHAPKCNQSWKSAAAPFPSRPGILRLHGEDIRSGQETSHTPDDPKGVGG